MKKYPLLLLLVFVCSGAFAREKKEQFPGADTSRNGMDVLYSLSVRPHRSINKKEFKKQYAANKVLWNKAFDFLRKTELKSLAPGRYPLAADSLFVSVTYGPEKQFDSTKWEAHRKYIDLQYIAQGKEKIGRENVKKAKLVRPYDEKRDVANYEAKGKYYIADPFQFFIFFPQDAHRPGIKVEEGDVRKVVVKIMAAR